MGYFADVLAQPAAQQAGRMTWEEYAKSVGFDQPSNVRTPVNAMNALGPMVGFSGPSTVDSGLFGGFEGESGWQGMQEGYKLNPELVTKLADYRFEPTFDSEGNRSVKLYDQAGSQVGYELRTGDHKGRAMKIAGAVIPALALAGFGVGAYGALSGGAGATAGAGAGSAGAGSGAFEGIGGAMAGGGAPMTAAEFAAAGGTAGTAGAGIALGGSAGYGGIGLAPGVAGATAGTYAPILGAGGAGLSTGAGLTAPLYAGGSALGMTAGASAAGAGSWLSSLASGAGGVLKGLTGAGGLTSLASLASGIYGMKLAGDAREASDPFAPYRAGYANKLAALEANPGLITSRPGFQAGLETIGRKSAATGYYGSGNMASALSRYSGDFYNQEAGRLAGLAGAGATPGAGQALGADLASQSLGSIGYGLAPMLERFMRGG